MSAQSPESAPRFTPAYAGKIVDQNVLSVQFEVHPRIRGEDMKDLKF